MKPHALRRFLWLTNLGLAAAVVGLAAWYVLKVRPAVAETTGRKPNHRPAEYEALRKDYESSRVTGLRWKPPMPVSDKEIHEVILREDYKKKQPTHWIFCGPLPPEDVKRDDNPNPGPPPPQGLDTLGKVSTVIINPPNSTILFKFGAGKSRAFGVGDFVRMGADDPQRFKIVGIREPRPRVYEIRYEVYGQDKDKPERTESMTYDRSGAGEGYPSFLRPEGETVATPRPADGSGGGAVPAPPAAGDGTSDGTAGGTSAGTSSGGTASTPAVVNPVAKPVEEMTVADLKPEIRRVPGDPSKRAVRLSDNTYRWLKQKNAKGLAGKVKTRVAKDSSGRTVGLRITGIEKDMPADVFDVKPGDILVSINGQRIASRSDAVRVVQGLDGKSLVTVVIDRRGKQITYRVDPSDPKNRRRVRYFEGFDW